MTCLVMLVVGKIVVHNRCIKINTNRLLRVLFCIMSKKLVSPIRVVSDPKMCLSSSANRNLDNIFIVIELY